MKENISINTWLLDSPRLFFRDDRRDLFKNLMAKNRTLIDIQLRDNLVLGEEAKHLLAINKKTYFDTRNRMWSFIKMFVFRREAFLSLLPLEIWIVSFADHSDDQYAQI